MPDVGEDFQSRDHKCFRMHFLISGLWWSGGELGQGSARWFQRQRIMDLGVFPRSPHHMAKEKHSRDSLLLQTTRQTCLVIIWDIYILKELGGRKCAFNTFHSDIKHVWWQKYGHRWSILCYLVRPGGRSREVRLGRALFQDRRSIAFHLDPRHQAACYQFSKIWTLLQIAF